MTEKLVLRHTLQVVDRRDDVPVAEAEIAIDDRERAAALKMHDPAPDCVHRRPVRRRNVDPEVE